MTSNVSVAYEGLSAAEVEEGREYIGKTCEGVDSATAGLSDAQWNFRPAPDRWSIAEIVEHVVVVQEIVLGPVQERLAKSALSSRLHSKTIDAIVRTQFPERMQRFPAPQPACPTGRWSPSVSLDRLHKNSERLTDILESTPDLRHRFTASMPLKAVSKGEFEEMDGYQWVLAATAHIERHLKQILEVKADGNFPPQ